MAAPTNIRQMNRRAILTTLLRLGGSTRSELARATAISQPTAGKIVDELTAEGVIGQCTPSTAPATRMGRPGNEVELDRKRPYFLGIQLGIAHTRLAALPVGPRATDVWDQTIATNDSFKSWIKNVSRVANKIFTPSIKAIIVSVPGVLDESAGRSLLSPNLRWLEGCDVASEIANVLGLPTLAIQEIRCLAKGHLAIEPQGESFLLVDFGIGLGSAPVIAGHLVDGQLPLSGELGHTPVAGNDRPCGCGGTGCLETILGRNHFFEAMGTATSDLADWRSTIPKLERRLPGRALQTIDAAGLGIAGALNVLGLNRVVLTGYLSELPEPMIAALREKIQTAAIAGRFGSVRTVTAPRRRQAGMASAGIERFLAPL
jgi:predicted NBD/HSP70 family sugar kinase